MPFVDLTRPITLVGVVNDNSAAYDLVLLAHVLSAAVGFVAVVVAGSFALTLRGALRRGGPLPTAVVRYFRPGVNWVGRVLFLVPVLGVALIAMSGGQWRYSDGWITIGLAAWFVVAMAAEGVLWPAERRLQLVVAAHGVDRDGDGGAGSDGIDPVTLCLRSGLVGFGLAVALVVVGVVMVAKP